MATKTGYYSAIMNTGVYKLVSYISNKEKIKNPK
jgi:hypothetical protein